MSIIHKIYKSHSYFRSIYVFLLNLCSICFPYFDNDAFTHHALHALDSHAPIHLWQVPSWTVQTQAKRPSMLSATGKSWPSDSCHWPSFHQSGVGTNTECRSCTGQRSLDAASHTNYRSMPPLDRVATVCHSSSRPHPSSSSLMQSNQGTLNRASSSVNSGWNRITGLCVKVEANHWWIF